MSDPSKFKSELPTLDSSEIDQITVLNADFPENENSIKEGDQENTENPIESEDSTDAGIDPEVYEDENNDDKLSVSSMSTTRENAEEAEIERPVEPQPPVVSVTEAPKESPPKEFSPPPVELQVEEPGKGFNDFQRNRKKNPPR